MTVALDLVGFGIVIPVLPLYAKDFGASPFVIGLLLAGYSLGQFLGAPVLGRLSDRLGRKPVLLLAVAGSALGNLVTGMAGSLAVLFVARLIDGLSGASVAVANAAVADLAPPAQRTRLFGMLGAAFGIGFVVGPAIGGLASFGGRSLPFYVAAGLAVLNGLLAWRRVPETRPGARPARQSVGAPQGRVAAAAALFKRRDRLSKLVLVSTIGVFAFTALESTFSLMTHARLGLGPAGVAVAFVCMGVLLTVLQAGATAKVVRKLGDVPTVRVALLCNLAGFLVLALGWSWPGVVLGTGFLVTGQGLLTPALSTAIAGDASESQRGFVFGVQQSAGALARVAGPLVALGLFGRVGVGAPYVVAALAVVVGLVVAARLLPRPASAGSSGSVS